MRGTADWHKFPMLAEDGPVMKLPRRATPPRNVERCRPLEWSRNGEAESKLPTSAWDLIDWLAIVGGIVSMAGLILALPPETMPWGILVPAGLALMAFAACAARRKDTAAS